MASTIELTHACVSRSVLYASGWPRPQVSLKATQAKMAGWLTSRAIASRMVFSQALRAPAFCCQVLGMSCRISMPSRSAQ